MKSRVLKILLPILLLTSGLDAQTNLQDTRNFFSEYRDNPVPNRTGAPNFYHGSDIYSAAIEGPEYPRLALEWEAGILFFLGRDDSDLDGKYMHHGFVTSFGFPLTKRVRPNHYLMLELMAGFDETGPVDHPSLTAGGNPTKIERKVESYSLLFKYKYYTPPILRDRVFPNLSLAIGNTFNSRKFNVYDRAAYNSGNRIPLNIPNQNFPYNEEDNSIFTMKADIGFKARLTNHIGIHTGYHLIYMGDNHDGYPIINKIDGDFLHALDLGLSLTF